MKLGFQLETEFFYVGNYDLFDFCDYCDYIGRWPQVGIWRQQNILYKKLDYLDKSSMNIEVKLVKGVTSFW